MENFELWFIIVCCVVGFIGSTIMSNKIAKETGKDVSGGFLKKLVMVAGCLGIILLTSCISGSSELEGHISEVVTTGILLLVVSLAILFLMNKSVAKPLPAILLSVFQVLYGMLVLIIMFFKILGHFLGIELGQGTQKKQAQYTKQQIDDKIIRENNVAPEYATPEQKDEKARTEGYSSYEDLENKANMTVED